MTFALVCLQLRYNDAVLANSSCQQAKFWRPCRKIRKYVRGKCKKGKVFLKCLHSC